MRCAQVITCLSQSLGVAFISSFRKYIRTEERHESRYTLCTIHSWVDWIGMVSGPMISALSSAIFRRLWSTQRIDHRSLQSHTWSWILRQWASERRWSAWVLKGSLRTCKTKVWGSQSIKSEIWDGNEIVQLAVYSVGTLYWGYL